MAQDKADAVSKVMEMIKEHSVEYVDFRFTDPRGKWQHTAQHVSTVDEEMFADGVMFDGSSDRKSTRLNSSHANISYAVFCLKKKKKEIINIISTDRNQTYIHPITKKYTTSQFR